MAEARTNSRFSKVRSLRPVWTTLLLSKSVMFSFRIPMTISILKQAMTAALAPTAEMRTSTIFLPNSPSAFGAEADATMAVPC